MPQSFVSIIIPTYNRIAKLRRTLASVLQQTHSNWEAIVIDDGSTDGTEEFFRTSILDGRVRYIRQANGGVAAARNTGLAAARGDYIAFLDSDDLWRPWKLEVQVLAFQQNPDVGMIWTDMEAIDSNDRILRPTYLRYFYTSYQWFSNDTLFPEHRPLAFPKAVSADVPRVIHIGEIFSPMLTGSLVHTSTVLLARQRFEAVGAFDESLRPVGEDYDFHLRTCRAGRVGFLDVVSTSYRIGDGDQLTNQRNGAILAEHFVRIVTTALDRDHERIDNRYRPLIYRALAQGHVWAAEELLEKGETRHARRHLIRAMCLGRGPRSWALLGASVLPRPVSASLRAAYRLCKRPTEIRRSFAATAK